MILLRCRTYGSPDWSEVRFDVDDLGIYMAKGVKELLKDNESLHVQLSTTEGLIKGTGWEEAEDFDWPEGEDL